MVCGGDARQGLRDNSGRGRARGRTRKKGNRQDCSAGGQVVGGGGGRVAGSRGRQAAGSGSSLSGSSPANSEKGSGPPGSPLLSAPAHLLAVLVVILADVAEVGREGLHGQGAGDLPTPPLDDHSCKTGGTSPLSLPCRPPFRSRACPSCLLVTTDSRGGDGKNHYQQHH